jgi:hypothetical protein
VPCVHYRTVYTVLTTGEETVVFHVSARKGGAGLPPSAWSGSGVHSRARLPQTAYPAVCLHSGEGPHAGRGYMSSPIHGSAAACRDPRSTTEARAPERNHITGRHDGVRPPLAAFIESRATETIPCPGQCPQRLLLPRRSRTRCPRQSGCDVSAGAAPGNVRGVGQHRGRVTLTTPDR